jgi:hypothetical protein
MDSESTDKYTGLRFGLFVFESVMAVAYLVIGVVLLFTNFLNNRLHPGMRIGLGITLGLYGVFRVYRAYKKISQKNE